MTAPCYGQAELFESTKPAMHRIARKLCLGTQTSSPCPLIDACKRLLEATREEYGVTHGPQGTWAGLLVAAPSRDDLRAAQLDALQGDARHDENPDRIAYEEEFFTDDEARRARAAYVRGERTAWAVAGNRIYARRHMRRQRAKRALEGAA